MPCVYCGCWIVDPSDMREEFQPNPHNVPGQPPLAGRYIQYHRLCWYVKSLSDWVIAYQQTRDNRSREPVYPVMLVLVGAVTQLLRLAVQTQ